MPLASGYYLGVVGAANKSQVALALDDGTIIRSKSDGPPLTIAVNVNVRNDLLRTISELAQDVELSLSSLVQKLDGICVAMSGVYAHRDRLDLANLMDQIGLVGDFPRVACEDADAHLAANFLDIGGVVIASTGSNVFIRHGGSAEPLRVDGWGSAIGDDGGGYDLGRKCLRALFKAEDGRYPGSDVLKELVLNHTGVSSIDGLIEWFYRSLRTSQWRSDVADLAIPLRHAAEDLEDPLAGKLLKAGADDLFYSFTTANCRIMRDQGEPAEQRRASLQNLAFVPLILEGGIFEHSSIYRRRFLEGIDALERGLVRWKPVAPAYRAVVGALALAICEQCCLPEERARPAILGTLQRSASDKWLDIRSHPLKDTR